MKNQDNPFPGDNNDPQSFLRIISHQLKAPVNSVETILRTIAGGYTGTIDEKTLQFVEKAIRKTEETRKIIADIFDYERMIRKDNPSFDEIDIVRLVNITVEKYVPEATAKNISVTTNVQKGMQIIVRGNSTELDLALSNLIENAVHYTPNNGKISVTLASKPEDSQCVIAVSDTGYGISPEDREKIFTPFFRSIKYKSSIAGTGLGLAIVQQVVQSYKGTISVESEPDKGTTFTVVLPVHKIITIEDNSIPRKKVLIIGGVTAGPKAAARLRRLDEDCEITIIEKSEFLSYAGCGLPAYVSGKLNSPKALMTTADNTLKDVHFFETIKNITVLSATEAIKIDRQKKVVSVKDLKDGVEQDLAYDVLVLATGAVPVVPPIPGIQQKGVYSFYNIEDAEEIKKVFQLKHAKDLFIIGGGLVGIETAESLVQAGARVTILEQNHTVLTLFDPEIAQKIQHELNSKGIKIVTDVTIQEIVPADGEALTIVTDSTRYRAEIIILSTGVAPNSVLGRNAGLTIGSAGGLMVNSFLQSSDPDIYAIGDCAESIHRLTRKHTYWPLGSVSTKMGRIAADNISGNRVSFSGHVGTAMFKIFDMQVARTGFSVKEAQDNGYTVETIIVSGLDRSHYHGDARPVVFKLICDAGTQVVLGAQAYGYGDVVGRIELLASSIAHSMTLDDMFQLDLGYYPAFNNPIDIVQTACLVLKSKITGFCRMISLEVYEQNPEKYKMIDVSPFSEHMPPQCTACISIPLENIRFETIPFKKTEHIVLCSRTSSRAYEAYRYMITLGYSNCVVLEGGFVYANHRMY